MGGGLEFFEKKLYVGDFGEKKLFVGDLVENKLFVRRFWPMYLMV